MPRVWLAKISSIMPGTGLHFNWHGLWMEEARGITLTGINRFMGISSCVNATKTLTSPVKSLSSLGLEWSRDAHLALTLLKKINRTQVMLEH